MESLDGKGCIDYETNYKYTDKQVYDESVTEYSVVADYMIANHVITFSYMENGQKKTFEGLLAEDGKTISIVDNPIVDVSCQYPKMYVIRPQFFMPLISLLSQASKKGVQYMKELELARQQSVDVTNFENKVNAFRDKFAGHYQKASEKFNKAVEEIDKSIKSLQKMKDNLLSSENYLRLANNDTEDLSIKKLTRANPTMKQKFEEARESSAVGKD